MRNFIKNSIVATLILFFVFSPFSIFTEIANAQQSGGFAQGGSYQTGNAYSGKSLQGYITGLAPTILKLPKCKEKIQSGVKKIFKNAPGGESLVPQANDNFAGSLNYQVEEAQAKTNSVPSYDELVNSKLNDSLVILKKVDKSTASTDENSSCLNAIGRMVIKILIQKLTMSTVQWIQGGFNGGPAFVQNPGRFFTEIARDEILGIGLEIQDGKLYPFGLSWIKGQAQAFNNKFQDNAKYSLNELIQQTTPQYTSQQFSADFAMGGWSAWMFMTQVPANNPLGFEVMASNELALRLDGTRSSWAQEVRKNLNEASGYLGDLRCADPEGLPKADHQKWLETQGKQGQQCKRFEYVTPGKMVAESATKVINFPENSLIDGEDLNDAMAAILDALIARFSADLYEKGFADFPNEGSNGAIIINMDEFNASGGYASKVDEDFPRNLHSNWLREHPDFDIRFDITQPIIDEQRIYVEKLDAQIPALDELIKTIWQLDYCIPGPNPDWEEVSSVDEYYRKIKVSAKAEMPFVLRAFTQVPIVGDIANAIFDDNAEDNLKANVAQYLAQIYDVYVYDGQDQALDNGDVRETLENTYESYRKIIYRTYFAREPIAPMPLVTAEARNEYWKVEGYQEMITNNHREVNTKKSIIRRLDEIKDAIDNLRAQYNIQPGYDPKVAPVAAFEAEIKKWSYYFGRLTKDMVTGDDIADADNLLKDITDRQEYVFKTLLQGPGGCEADMLNLYNNNPKDYNKYARRQPYLLPIYYLYGNPVYNPGGGNQGGNNPPAVNTTKYFGANSPSIPNGGAWVGDNGQGTWWSGTGGNGVMVFVGIGGSGSFTGSGISGNWTGQCLNGNCQVGSQNSWYGSSGQGLYIIESCNGTSCAGKYSGGNGSGINGGGFAPSNGIWIGENGLNPTNINGTWTMTGQNSGTGSWTGVSFNGPNGLMATGTWSGGTQQQGNAGLWLPGSPPSGPGPAPDPACTSGPCNKTTWSEDKVQNWDPNQGFCYGCIYWNYWARPYDQHAYVKPPASGDPDKPRPEDGPNLSVIADKTCKDLFIDVVLITHPTQDNPKDPMTDYGLADGAALGSYEDGYTPGRNICGVITRRFEKLFEIY